MKTGRSSEIRSDRGRFVSTASIGLGALVAGAVCMYFANRMWLSPAPRIPSSSEHSENNDSAHQGERSGNEDGATVTLPREKWDVAGLRVESVIRGTLPGRVWVTGKLTLNEDRLAHIYSLADGQVHDVLVQFGDDVSQGQTLAVIDSKEVGAAKLDLYRSQLNAEFARVNHEWAQKISTNTQALITALMKQPPFESIDEMFANRPMGEYRQQLITAYARLYKSRKDAERLEPLAAQGATAGSQALAARAAYEADRATFQALLEQLRFTSWQQALLAEQKLRQTEQTVAAARSRLFILGYRQADLEDFDPLREGEAIAHYQIRSPFAGTIIGKNVVLGERVGADTEMFQVADLSTLWVQADIYQKDLPRTRQLGEELRFRPPGMEKSYTAKIFYTGDVFDPATRTIRLRALVDNPDRRLKAGMFVDVALPGLGVSDALIIPASALQKVDGSESVFVQIGDDTFQLRRILTGLKTDEWVHVREGLQEGESLVTSGAFSLQSELMKESISHGH